MKLNKKALISVFATCLILTGCGSSKDYIEMPSGTYQGNNFIIYTPDGAGSGNSDSDTGYVSNDGTTETTSTEENDTPEITKVDNYAERYENAYNRYTTDTLYVEFTVLDTDYDAGSTEKTSYTVAYNANLSYVKTTDNLGNTSVVISNDKASYLVDYDNKIAEKAELGTFLYTSRNDLNLLFSPSDGSYVGTTTKTFDGVDYSVDTYVYNNIDFDVYYDNSDELIMIVNKSDSLEKSILIEKMTVCDSKDIFKLSKDYTIKNYEER